VAHRADRSRTKPSKVEQRELVAGLLLDIES